MGKIIATKVLQCGLYWPTLIKDAHLYCKSCPKCQQFEKISRRNVMHLSYIIIVEIFDVWAINFMGLVPSYFGNEYTLLVVDYMSTWVEAVPTRTIEARIIVKFFRENIFSKYGMPALSLVSIVLILTMVLLIHC